MTAEALAGLIDARQLPDVAELIAHGRALASQWTVAPCPFLSEHGVACEADYKRRSAAAGRLMGHAQIGWRDPAKSREAWARIHGACAARGVSIDRYGICLDWSMGIPRETRAGAMRGTGLILSGPDDFAALLTAGRVDELAVFTAGLAIGAEGHPGLAALGLDGLADARRFRLTSVDQVGADILHRWRAD